MRRGKLPIDEKTGLYLVDLETLRAICYWRDGLPRASVLAAALGLAGEGAVRARMKRLEASGHLELFKVGGNGLPVVPYLTSKGREAAGPPEPQPEVRFFRPKLAPALPVYPLPCSGLQQAVAEPSFVQSPFNNWREGDYLVYAEGDSMWNARTRQGVLPGSTLQMRPDIYPENGQICHAELIGEAGDHECTLKVFHQDEISGLVTLQPLNPEYPDIVLPMEKVEVRGVAVEIVAPVSRFPRRDRK